LGVVITVAGVLCGVQTAGSGGNTVLARVTISPIFIAALVVGLALGASVGVYWRTNHLLGPNPSAIATRWKEAAKEAGDHEKEIIKRLFELAYRSPEEGKPSSLDPILFAGVPASECQNFRTAPLETLETEMLASTNPRVRAFAKRCSGHPTILKAAVEELICPQK
jgi:hypothetical protein